MSRIEIERLDHSAGLDLPCYATDGAAGIDLVAANNQPVVIPPGKREVIPTGVKIAIPQGYVGILAGRSGLGIKHGITLSNSVGIIDSDYRGEIMVGLINQDAGPYMIIRGDRIAQLIITEAPRLPLIEISKLPSTVRGEGGFGSTGR